MWSSLNPALKAVTVLLAVVGALAVIVGIMYLAMPSDSLPTFFPAHYPHSHVHATKHGYAALALGIVLLVAAIALPSTQRRRAA